MEIQNYELSEMHNLIIRVYGGEKIYSNAVVGGVFIKYRGCGAVLYQPFTKLVKLIMIFSSISDTFWARKIRQLELTAIIATKVLRFEGECHRLVNTTLCMCKNIQLFPIGLFLNFPHDQRKNIFLVYY